MNRIILILLLSLSIHECFALDENVRLSQVGAGSFFYFDTTDETLIKERKKTWMSESDGVRLRCSLYFNSRFDENFIKKEEIIKYRLDSLNYQSTFNRSRPSEYSETYRFSFKNSDTRTPLIGFECFSSRGRELEHLKVSDVNRLLKDGAHLQLENVTDKKEVPRVDDIVENFKSSFRLLKDLKFHYEGKESSFRPIKSPIVSKGIIYYQGNETGSPTRCALDDSPQVFNEEYTLKAGKEYDTQYFQTFSFIGQNRNYGNLSLSLKYGGFTIRCGHRELENLNGVIIFEGMSL